ncbi:hemolysin III family protein [Balneolales bacterium ANBcel1]|nr:hemolysin III family protein [Balneolales bacterium ANBcel1]
MKILRFLISRVREPANAYTHLAAVLLSIPALVLLIHRALLYGQPTHVVAFTIFGSSMTLLYLASTLYHMLPLSEKGIKLLRRIDHIMIYVLIAGTYTPITLIALDGFTGWALFVTIWSLAVFGIFFKLLWFHAPKWVSLVIYLGMGWLAIFFLPSLWKDFPPQALAWIIAGGVIYSVGALLYGLKWPNPSPKYFNFHAIWHIMVMAASFCFFWVMYQYVVFI